MKRHCWSVSARDNFNCITTHEYNGAEYTDGEVGTPNGFVSVYSEESLSSYRFIWGGRLYYMSEHVPRNARGLAIVAGKLVKRIVAGEWEE